MELNSSTVARLFSLKALPLLLCCCAVSALAFHADAASAEDYFDLPPEQLLSAEVISVSKRAERISDSPAAIYVITSDDLMRSGMTSIPEALRMVPGVQVAQADSNSWAVSIRGFNGTFSNKLLVMIDGRTVYNPLFAGTYWELQDLVLDDIERIEVVRGPGGALWGANAVNGVINVITKDTAATQGNVVNAMYGTHENGTLSARHGGRFGEGGTYRVYGKVFDRDSFRAPSGGDADDDWHSYRGGFRSDWDGDFTLQGDVYRIFTDQLNSTPTLTAPYALIEKETMVSEGANLLGRWKKAYEGGALLSLRSYLDYTARDQILLKDERLIWDTEVQYDLAAYGPHELSFGAGYRYTGDDLGSSPSVEFSPVRRQDSLFSAFLQDKITLVPREWYLTLGSKFEHNDYTGIEAQPNARLQWHPDDRQTIWAAVSRAVRTPSRLEHDLDQTLVVLPPGVLAGIPAKAVLEANRDFDSERLVAYEIGYRNQVTPAVSLDASLFYNDYDDLSTIGFLQAGVVNNGVDPVHLLFPVDAINGMTAETYGFEASAAWNVTKNWKLSATYSFLDMQLHVARSNGFNLESAEDASPHHQASLRSSWTVSDSVSLDSAAYYVDELSGSDVDDYIRVDINLGWQVSPRVRFNLVGQNLLDGSHREFNSETALNAAEIERGVYGRLSWQF